MNKLVAAILILGVAICGVAQAGSIPVPNGSFEEIYKPGSTTITADITGMWTNGVGPDTPMNPGQEVTFSDGSTGSVVDVPGWVNADGWTTPYNWTQGSASVAKQSANPPDGEHYFTANGPGWGHPTSGAAVSAAPLAMIEAGLDYTASMFVSGPITPVVLDLMADGVVLAPTSVVDPGTYAWDEVAKTYSAASLAPYVGQSLTLRIGWGPVPDGGSQAHLDNVTLTTSVVPEPSTMLLAAIGLLSLVFCSRRRR